MEIIKRDHRITEYNPDKIYKAILAAYKDKTPAMQEEDYEQCRKVTTKVDFDIKDLENNGLKKIPIGVIQSLVENRLLDSGLFKVYESYVGYRIQRDIERYGYGDSYYAKFTLGRY